MAFAPQQQQPLNYGQGAVLSEQLEIFISCRNLPKMDMNSPSGMIIPGHQFINQNIIKTHINLPIRSICSNKSKKRTKQSIQ